MLKNRWNRMNKFRKRTFAIALSTAIVSTSLNIGSIAANAGTSARGRVIVAFEDLPDEIAYQTVPIGGSRVDVTFPTELNVLLYTDEEEEASKDRSSSSSVRVVVDSGETGSSSVKVAEETTEENKTVVVVSDNAEGSGPESGTGAASEQNTGSGSSSTVVTVPSSESGSTQDNTGTTDNGQTDTVNTDNAGNGAGASDSSVTQDSGMAQEGGAAQEGSTAQDNSAAQENNIAQDSATPQDSSTPQDNSAQDSAEQTDNAQNDGAAAGGAENSGASESEGSGDGSTDSGSESSESSTENTSGKNIIHGIMNAFAPVRAYAAETVTAGAGAENNAASESAEEAQDKQENPAEPASDPTGESNTGNTGSTDNIVNEEPAGEPEGSPDEKATENKEEVPAAGDKEKSGDKADGASQNTAETEKDENNESGTPEESVENKTGVSSASVSESETKESREEASESGTGSSSSSAVTVVNADTEEENKKTEDTGVRKLKDGEERVLKDVRWKIDKDRSEYGSRFQAVREGDVFIFVPDIKAYGLKSDVDLPEIRVTIGEREDADTASDNSASDNSASENSASDNSISKNSVSKNARPEFDQFAIVGGVRISVTAPEGVFPEGAVLKVRSVNGAEDKQKIEDVIRQDMGSADTTVSGENAGAELNLLSFDITITDVSGNEIQPDTEYGNPDVTFSNVDMIGEAGEGSEIKVYHFDDGLQSASAMDASVDGSENAVSVSADHFSVFTAAVLGADSTSGIEIADMWFATDFDIVTMDRQYYFREYLNIKGKDGRIYNKNINSKDFLKIMDGLTFVIVSQRPAGSIRNWQQNMGKSGRDAFIIPGSRVIGYPPADSVVLNVIGESDSFLLPFPNKDGFVPVTDITAEGALPLVVGQEYTLKDNKLTWEEEDVTYTYTFDIVPANATNKNIIWNVRTRDTSTNPWVDVVKDAEGKFTVPGSSDQNAESEYQLYATIEDGIDKGTPFTKSFEQTVRGGAYSFIVVEESEFPYYFNGYAEDAQLFATNDKNEIAARLTWGIYSDTNGNGGSVEGAAYSVMQKYYSGDGGISAVNWKDIDSAVIDSGMYNIPVSEFLENKKNYIYGRVTIRNGVKTYVIYESSEYIAYDTIAPSIQINSAELSGDMGTADLFASDALSGVDTVYLMARESTSTAPGAEEIIKKGVSVNAADVEISTAGLDPSKKYVFYAVAEDKAGNLSTVAKKTAVVNPGTVSANITVNGKVYDTLQGSDKLGDTVTEPKEISISANVSKGLIKSVQYYISDKFMASESEIEKAAGSSWASYNDSSRPYLKSNQLNYIYAKITQNDDASTVTYISTQGILENETVDASIEVNGKTYDMLQSTDATDTYLNSNKAITINAVPKNDSETGKVKSIQYYISQTYLPSAEAAEKAAGVNWSTYDASAKPMLKTNQLNYVYAKITQNDKAGTATYVSTKGIWEDETAPSVTEIKETANDEYTEATVKVTGSDNESGLKTYYLLPRKKTEQVPDANTIKTTGQSNTTGAFKVSPISKSDPYIYYAVVEDKAGNTSPVANQSGNIPGGDVSATIKVLDKSYKNLNSSSKIGGYTNENKTFSISADSKGSPVKSIEYYISDKLITSTEELIKEATTSGSSKSQSTQTTVTTNKDGSMTVTTTTGDNTSDTGKWTKYNDSNKPYLKKNQLNYIYARVTQSDTAATKTYVSTEGIWEDEVKPTATSVKGTPKDTSAEVTVKGTDKHSGVKNYYLMAKPVSDAAPSDAEAVKSGGTGNETGKFNLSGLTANTAYSLYAVVEDNAGNLSDFKKGKMTTKKAAAAAGAAAGAKAAAAGKSSSGTGGSNASKRKSSSSDKAAKGSNSSSTNAEAIRDGVPFIDDASEGILIGRAETSGWDRIESETDKAKEADWISVDMNGSTVVPKAALAKIAGRDVTCYFEMNDDVTWAVNGLSFDGAPEQDIDFRVRLDTRNIPARLIKEIADVYPHTNVTLEHNGPFGFTAILSLYLGEQGDGMYGNLYYYNEEDKGLEFVESSPVDGSGRASFEFTHASDYTVIVRGESLTSKTAEALAAANLDGAGGTAGGSNGGINGGPGNISRDTTRIWLLVVSVISLVLCGFILFMPDKRRRRGRYQGA